MSLTIYIEGGGDSKDLKTRCREGFHNFLDKALPTGHRPKLVACGTRRNAYDDFRIALKANPGESAVLLVDSEDPIAPGAAVWLHVQTREDDGWDKPVGAGDDHLQFMVCCMESWLVADPDSLGRLYGQGFSARALPKTTSLETVHRGLILDALRRATQKTQKGQYRKGKDSFTALAAIDANVVRTRMLYCERLFQSLLA